MASVLRSRLSADPATAPPVVVPSNYMAALTDALFSKLGMTKSSNTYTLDKTRYREIINNLASGESIKVVVTCCQAGQEDLMNADQFKKELGKLADNRNADREAIYRFEYNGGAVVYYLFYKTASMIKYAILATSDNEFSERMKTAGLDLNGPTFSKSDEFDFDFSNQTITSSRYPTHKFGQASVREPLSSPPAELPPSRPTESDTEEEEEFDVEIVGKPGPAENPAPSEKPAEAQKTTSSPVQNKGFGRQIAEGFGNAAWNLLAGAGQLLTQGAAATGSAIASKATSMLSSGGDSKSASGSTRGSTSASKTAGTFTSTTNKYDAFGGVLGFEGLINKKNLPTTMVKGPGAFAESELIVVNTNDPDEVFVRYVPIVGIRVSI